MQASAAPGRATTPLSADIASAKEPTAKREYRQFQLPPTNRPQRAKQTLIQLDIPPEIELKHEIPLPTVLLWTQTKVTPPARKQFVAPPTQAHPAVTQSLPTAVALEPPNEEVTISNVNVAATILNRTQRTFVPPSVASPVSKPGQEPAIEMPQIGLTTSVQPSAANIISLPSTPARGATLAGLPPANQIARRDVASGGSSVGEGGGAGLGQPGAGSSGAGPSSGVGTASGTDRGGNAASPGSGKAGAAGSGTAMASMAGGGRGPSGGTGSSATTAGAGGSGGTTSGNGSGAAGGNGTASTGSGSASTGSNTGLDAGRRIPGVTRIDLPKDGKFGVVVLGSADSARYPETVGVLSSKILYTVYLKVGLRRNWIMQYALAKESERVAPRKGSTPQLEAPWPFLIERPDRWSASDPDYIMVHGFITAAGRFDQLAVVYPNELEKEELLLSSLKLWDFRPASRDGEPTEVEVLLIIPHEAE